jgi:hypothetical protein
MVFESNPNSLRTIVYILIPYMLSGILVFKNEIPVFKAKEESFRSFKSPNYLA